ncbi:MAG: DNA replication and repair protein RecF, partial [Deltaproteobacteria bacterium]
MRIEQLCLRNFRNLRHVDLSCRQTRCIVLQGDNAQGKTNVLEAMYMVATGRSFRLAPTEQMVGRDGVAARIEATIERDAVRHQVDVVLNGKSRRLEVDGRALTRATKLLEMVNMVAFFPDDLRL